MSVIIRQDKLWIRFWKKVNKTNSCWIWTAATNNTGYSVFYYGNGKYGVAHRFLYEQLNGKLPRKFDLDHLCRNRACVNPSHLEPVSRAENARRSPGLMGQWKKKLTHCPQGHKYGGTNLYTTSQGWRQCRTCIRARSIKT